MKRLVIVLIMSLWLTACSAQPPVIPTPVPTSNPTATSLPSATPVPPTATATMAPTTTPTAVPVALQETPYPVPAAAIAIDNIAALRLLARWGRGQVENASWSADDKLISLTTVSGTYLYDWRNPGDIRQVAGSAVLAPSGLLAAALPDERIQVRMVKDSNLLYETTGGLYRFSPDGARLAVAAADSVRLLAAASGTPVFTGEIKQVQAFEFSRDGQWLLALDPQKLHVIKPDDKKEVRTLKYFRLIRAELSQDGSLLVVQGYANADDPVIEIYKTSDWSKSGTIKTRSQFMLMPDGKRLYTYSNYPEQGKIELFQLPEGKSLPGLSAPGSVAGMSASPDARWVAFSILEPTRGYIDVYTPDGKRLYQFPCSLSCEGQTPLFSADGKYLAAFGLQPGFNENLGSAFVYELKTGTQVLLVKGRRDASLSPVKKIAFSSDSAALLVHTGGREENVQLWQIMDGKNLNTLEWGLQTLSLGSLSPDGKLAAVFNGSFTTQMLAITNGKAGQKLDNLGLSRFVSDGANLLAAETRNARTVAVSIIRLADGKASTTIPVNGDQGFTVASTGLQFATWKDFSVSILESPNGKRNASLTAVGRPDVHLSQGFFTQDAKGFVAGDDKGSVWYWKLPEAKPVWIADGHRRGVTALAQTRDGSVLASGAADGTIKYWNIADGKAKGSFVLNPGYEDFTFTRLNDMTFSPDGKLLALTGTMTAGNVTTSLTRITLLVSVENNALVRLLRGGGDKIVFSPDGKLLFASGDGSVSVWGVLP